MMNCYINRSFGATRSLPQILLCAVGLLIMSGLAATAQTCPPPDYDAVQRFDLEKYKGSWHTIKQLPVSYQPSDQLNCVFVNYEIDRSSESLRCRLLGCSDPVAFSIFNSARDGSTTGRVVAVNFRGTIRDATNNPAKVFVGPNFIPNLLRQSSNYWVVAVGTYAELPGLQSEPASPDQYEWAIVTSSEPTVQGRNSTKCFSSGGYWYFSRKPVPPAGTMEAIDAVASNLGLDTSVLETVNHTGCEYATEQRDLLSGFFFFGIFDRFF